MSKITYSKYLELARDPETDDKTLLSYSIIERGRGGFDFTIKPNPEKVELTENDIEFENALQIGNGFCRFRRQSRFKRRKLFGCKLPVLVSEGDSWYQFPLLIDEVIDQLEDDYLVWSVGAAGDTAENIVYGNNTEYLKALDDNRDEVRGFLFSAAGNDIIGEDPATGRAVLLDMLRDFNGDPNDVQGHIDLDMLNSKMDFLRGAYTKVIDDIREKTEFENLPIVIHGYDYAFPYPWGDDPRNPIHAAKDEWLGGPMSEHRIEDPKLRRNIIKFLIDRLYALLETLAGQSESTGVWLVDCRGAMPEVSDWEDEIHGTSAGFNKVGERFMTVLSKALKTKEV